VRAEKACDTYFFSQMFGVSVLLKLVLIPRMRGHCEAPQNFHTLSFIHSGIKFAATTLVRVSQQGPSLPLGPTEWFSGSHEKRPLLNSSAVILQNPINEQEATSVHSLWKGVTNHDRLRTADLGYCLRVFSA